MKSIKLDKNGDSVMVDGDFVWIEGDEELAQQVAITLKTAKEEWFLDLDEGMDRTPFFSKTFLENEAKDSLIEAVGQVPGIAMAEDISFSRSGRVLTVSMTLRKEDGDTLELQEVEI